MVLKRGYVYLIKPRYKDGPFKIGRTSGDLKRRLSTLQTAHYEDLEVLLVIECENPSHLEKFFHRTLKEYWIRGEWFAANRIVYDVMISQPGAFTPIGTARDMWRLLPNRPWHAAKPRSEIKAQMARSSTLGEVGQGDITAERSIN